LRGVSCLISRGRLRAESPMGFEESGYFAAGGVGFIPRLKEWKITCRRQPNNLVTPYSKMGRHANPMEVYYEHATSNEYGARLPVEFINIASFQSVAQQLYEESNGDFTSGWSGKILNPTSPLEVCKNIEQQIDAVAEPSPSLGLTIRLIRRDYSFPSLPILSQSNITRIDRYAPGAYEDTIGKVIVPFDDPDNNFAPRPGIYIDPANQVIQDGRIASQTNQYLGVGDYLTANMLATRDGRALAIPRPPLECSVLPSIGRTLQVGGVARFAWSQPTLEKVMRITALAPGNTDDSDYSLTMVEDQFATGARVGGNPGATSHVDPSAGLSVAPPSASWDAVLHPPDGLAQIVIENADSTLTTYVEGAIVFGFYASGGQYARIYVTEPGGVESLSPIQLAPDDDNKATFRWPAVATGTYTFCVQTFSITGATNGTKVCESIDVQLAELRLLEDGTTRHLEDGTARIME
jgi:hypothetical protein